MDARADWPHGHVISFLCRHAFRRRCMQAIDDAIGRRSCPRYFRLPRRNFCRHNELFLLIVRAGISRKPLTQHAFTHGENDKTLCQTRAMIRDISPRACSQHCHSPLSVAASFAGRRLSTQLFSCAREFHDLAEIRWRQNLMASNDCLLPSSPPKDDMIQDASRPQRCRSSEKPADAADNTNTNKVSPAGRRRIRHFSDAGRYSPPAASRHYADISLRCHVATRN